MSYFLNKCWTRRGLKSSFAIIHLSYIGKTSAFNAPLLFLGVNPFKGVGCESVKLNSSRGHHTFKTAPKVIIIGGVAGGATCATRCRRVNEKANITIYEKGPHISFANCGLPYYIGGVIKERKDLLLSTAEHFRKQFNINVQLGHEVLSIDRNKKAVQVMDVSRNEIITDPYDYLVLSPGATPVKPNLPGIGSDGIFTLRNIPDSDLILQWINERQAKRAVIVGGGFIGLEMAENLVHKGLEVTLFEKSNQVMSPFDYEMVSDLHHHLLEQGVKLHLKTAIQGFHKNGKNIIVNTSSGDVEGELVILVVGIKSDTRLARECGLQLGSLGGIQVNSQMQTSDPFIYAVGDSVESEDFVTHQKVMVALAGPANRQARVAADSICGKGTSKYRGVQGSAICKVFNRTVAITGANEKTLQSLGIPYKKIYSHAQHHVGYYPGANRVSMKVLFRPENGQILGGQAIGVDGVDKRIDILSLAIQGNMSMQDLEEAELCYAPQFGAGKDPINITGMIASNSLRGDQPLVHWKEPSFQSQKPESFILDVRSKAEFDKGHIKGAVLIPLPELRSRLCEIPKNQPIYIYCGVGQRGYYATRVLVQNGFEAFNISGGYRTFEMSRASEES